MFVVHVMFDSIPHVLCWIMYETLLTRVFSDCWKQQLNHGLNSRVLHFVRASLLAFNSTSDFRK